MSQKRKNNPWKEYGAPFLLGFAFISGLFVVIEPRNEEVKLPEDIAIILSPHFDDAALSLGGFMAERKTPLIVVTFFSGKPPETFEGEWDKRSGFKNSDEALATRVEENTLALGQVGAYPLNLRYVDFQYRYDRSPDSEEKILRSMKNDIETVLKDFSNTENISLYGPSEFGPNITHPDHKLVHDAFAKVAREKAEQNSPRRIRFFFYEDFPYVRHYETSTSTSLKTFLERTNGSVSLHEIPLNLSPAALNKKLESIKTYASQEKAFESLGNDIITDAKIFTENRCRKIQPIFYGCEVVHEISSKI